MNESCLLTEEKAILDFRSLYQQYGYSRFKMSRFEPYDLYVRNKDFLVSDRMITFTDADGSLLALKPDVTISVIKNARGSAAGVRKLYYNESVYRAGKSGGFREITQTGLECIGQVDQYNICEVLLLAVKSLALISADYVLDLSHLGLVAACISAAGIPEEAFPQALQCVREKNSSGLAALSERLGLEPEGRRLLLTLTDTYGDMDRVLASLSALPLPAQAVQAVEQLKAIAAALAALGLKERVRIDFSVINDMSYYNGIVFQGFIQGAPHSVLSGGQYDRLVRKMGRSDGAIGFAVYLDELEALDSGEDPYDVDVLLLYDESSDLSRLLAQVEELTGQGLRVLPRPAVPEKLKYRRLVRVDAGEAR